MEQKVTISLEFNNREDAAAFLMGAPKTAKATATVHPESFAATQSSQVVAPQQFAATPVAVETPKALTGLEKARATKKANADAKKAAAQTQVAVPASNVPTSAFPAAPAQPLSPMPAAPQGVPMPSGMPQMGQPAVNYGAPMNAPGPMTMQAPQQTYKAPVQQAPVQQAPQAWDKNAVVMGISMKCQESGQPKENIQALFNQIFQEQGITPSPVGQLNDQDLYKFQGSFYQKIAQYGQHLV